MLDVKQRHDKYGDKALQTQYRLLTS